MMDIKSVENASLVEKTIELAIKFGSSPTEDINDLLKIGRDEILRRFKVAESNIQADQEMNIK